MPPFLALRDNMSQQRPKDNPALSTIDAKGGNPFHDAPEYGLLAKDEGKALAELFLQERISVAGRVDPVIYPAFIRDALEARGPHIMVVRMHGRIAGWSVGVIDSRRYWISFLFRHPLAGIGILAGLWLQRCRQFIKARRTTGDDKEPESSLPRWRPEDRYRWGKNGRSSARLIDTTVLPHLRGAGLGGELQFHHLRELRKQGILTAEAYVRIEKSGWLRFNARSGFKVAGRNAQSLLMAIDLDKFSGDDG